MGVLLNINIQTKLTSSRHIAHVFTADVTMVKRVHWNSLYTNKQYADLLHGRWSRTDPVSKEGYDWPPGSGLRLRPDA